MLLFADASSYSHVENYQTVQPIHINSAIPNGWNLSTRVSNKVTYIIIYSTFSFCSVIFRKFKLVYLSTLPHFLVNIWLKTKFSDTMIFKYSYGGQQRVKLKRTVKIQKVWETFSAMKVIVMSSTKSGLVTGHGFKQVNNI